MVGLVDSHFRDKKKEKDIGKDDDRGFDLVRAKGMELETSCDSHLGRSDVSARKLFDACLANTSTGKGLIILLHGAPGVGKTSTAGKFDS